MRDDLSGQVIEGRLRILHCRSRDAEIALYRGELLRTEKPFLMKLALDPGLRPRLSHEAWLLAGVEHPDVIELYNMGELEDGRPYLLLEWLEGITLGDRLRHGEPPSVTEAVALVARLCAVLQAFHDRGHCLRHLCPDHVMVCAGDAVKLWTALYAAPLPRPDSIALTRASTAGDIRHPAYAAPELALGQAVDGRADIYSAGIILFELLAGRPPFTGDGLELLGHQVNTPPPPLPESVPDALARLVQRALAKEPADRFESARAMQAELIALGQE